MSTWSNIVRGVAIGDAWGNPNEFQSIGSLTSKCPQGPTLPNFLEITDDTQMTLYLGSALDDSWDGTQAEVQEAIKVAFLEYAVDPDNNRAPGATVMGSLGRLRGAKSWVDATSKTSDGCGTVMRTSPCAFLPEDRWVGATAYAAAITHGTANGVAAAILNVALLRDIMTGQVKIGEMAERALVLCETAEKRGLTDTGTWIEGLDINLVDGFNEMARILRLVLAELPALVLNPWALKADPSHIAGMGGGWRAHDCLIAAITSADMIQNHPWLALRRAVTTGGDSDSIGAVAGGLLGAQYPDAFEKLWTKHDVRVRLEKRYREWIEEEADDYPFEDPKPQSWIKKLVGVK